MLASINLRSMEKQQSLMTTAKTLMQDLALINCLMTCLSDKV